MQLAFFGRSEEAAGRFMMKPCSSLQPIISFAAQLFLSGFWVFLHIYKLVACPAIRGIYSSTLLSKVVWSRFTNCFQAIGIRVKDLDIAFVCEFSPRGKEVWQAQMAQLQVLLFPELCPDVFEIAAKHREAHCHHCCQEAAPGEPLAGIEHR